MSSLFLFGGSKPRGTLKNPLKSVQFAVALRSVCDFDFNLAVLQAAHGGG